MLSFCMLGDIYSVSREQFKFYCINIFNLEIKTQKFSRKSDLISFLAHFLDKRHLLSPVHIRYYRYYDSCIYNDDKHTKRLNFSKREVLLQVLIYGGFSIQDVFLWSLQVPMTSFTLEGRASICFSQ